MELSLTNNLVPKHSIANDADVAALLDKTGKPLEMLPLVHLEDPALTGLDAKTGDVIKIERKSPITNKIELYYRLVVEQ